MTIQIKDNSTLTLEDKDIEQLKVSGIIDQSINTLKANKGLLMFPNSFSGKKEKEEEDKVITLIGEKTVKTGNIAGFIGGEGWNIHITSRFTKDNDDFLLHYLLMKILCINLFNMKSNISVEGTDLPMLLFPSFLKVALTQGLFKQYKSFERNDANVRGVIDINRHIRTNIPFRGTIAYRSREFAHDNDVTQLVRHTIEYMKNTPLGRMVLNNDTVVKESVRHIIDATPSYNPGFRQRIINQNLKPLSHPYFSHYTQLQSLCLQILGEQKLMYRDNDYGRRIYGVLFDVAWLWEEYLAVILKDLGFTHPRNNVGEGGKDILKDKNILPMKENENGYKYKGRIYPDFHYSPKNKTQLILDAKYKPLNSGVYKDDLYQMITYMHCYEAPRGSFVFPFPESEELKEAKESALNLTRKEAISIIPFTIPKNKESWEAFCEDMKQSEIKFEESINKYLNNSIG